RAGWHIQFAISPYTPDAALVSIAAVVGVSAPVLVEVVASPASVSPSAVESSLEHAASARAATARAVSVRGARMARVWPGEGRGAWSGPQTGEGEETQHHEDTGGDAAHHPDRQHAHDGLSGGHRECRDAGEGEERAEPHRRGCPRARR